jgi:hypothetical protein
VGPFLEEKKNKEIGENGGGEGKITRGYVGVTPQGDGKV